MKSYWWFNWPHSKGGVVMKCVLLDADVVFLAVTPDLLKWDIFLIYRSNMTYETSFGDTGIKQASDGVLVYTFPLILLLREVSTHIYVRTNAILNKQRKITHFIWHNF